MDKPHPNLDIQSFPLQTQHTESVQRMEVTLVLKVISIPSGTRAHHSTMQRMVLPAIFPRKMSSLLTYLVLHTQF